MRFNRTVRERSSFFILDKFNLSEYIWVNPLDCFLVRQSLLNLGLGWRYLHINYDVLRLLLVVFRLYCWSYAFRG